MLDFEVLILELGAVNRLAARAGAVREVATLLSIPAIFKQAPVGTWTQHARACNINWGTRETVSVTTGRAAQQQRTDAMEDTPLAGRENTGASQLFV